MAGACKVCQGTTGADDPFCEGCGGGVQVAEIVEPEVAEVEVSEPAPFGEAEGLAFADQDEALDAAHLASDDD
jgi:hypothetical protein